MSEADMRDAMNRKTDLCKENCRGKLNLKTMLRYLSIAIYPIYYVKSLFPFYNIVSRFLKRISRFL